MFGNSFFVFLLVFMLWGLGPVWAKDGEPSTLISKENTPVGCKPDYKKNRYVCLNGTEIDSEGNVYKDGVMIQTLDGNGDSKRDAKSNSEQVYSINSSSEYDDYYAYEHQKKPSNGKVEASSEKNKNFAIGLDVAFFVPVVDADSFNPGFGLVLNLKRFLSEDVALSLNVGHLQSLSKSNSLGGFGYVDTSVGYSLAMVGLNLAFLEVELGYNQAGFNLGQLSFKQHYLGSYIGLLKQFEMVGLKIGYFAPDVSDLSSQGSFLAMIGFSFFP